MRKKFNTTLEETLIIKTKVAAVEQGKDANDIIEEALQDYFKKKDAKK